MTECIDPSEKHSFNKSFDQFPEIVKYKNDRKRYLEHQRKKKRSMWTSAYNCHARGTITDEQYATIKQRLKDNDCDFTVMDYVKLNRKPKNIKNKNIV